MSGTTLKQIKVYMTPAQREHLRDCAQTLGMAQSELIRQAISDYMVTRNLDALPDDLNPQGIRKDYEAMTEMSIK